MKSIIESLETQIKNVEHEILVNKRTLVNLLERQSSIENDIDKSNIKIIEFKRAIEILKGESNEITSENKKTKRKSNNS